MQSPEPSGPPVHPFEQSWYVRGPDQTYGPYPGRELRAFASSGRLRRETEVALAGGSEWLRAGDIPAFASFFGALTPPPAIAGAEAAGLGHLHFAGFWIRLGAYAIDVVLLYLITFVLGGIIGLVLLGNANVAQAIAGVVGFVFAILFFVVPVGGGWQATPGKRICNLRIVRENGDRVGYGTATGRYLAYFLSSIILGFGFFMIGWTSQKRGLHDMVCGTRVVYGRT